MRKALLSSFLIHAGIVALAWAFLPARAAMHKKADLSEPVDRWAGKTAELGGQDVHDVTVEPNAPDPAPLPPVKPAILPVPAALATSTQRRDDAPNERAPSSTRKPEKQSAMNTVSPSLAAPTRPSRPRRLGTDRGATSEAGGSGEPFGAEGKSSVRSLGRAFTRAIPPACQADPIWSKMPVGDGGSIEITIRLDERGKIVNFTPSSSSRPPHLLSLVKRTLALLEAGTFALKGSVGAGTETLRIHARLSDVTPTEEGGATALAFGEGKASFTQESGRKVEVNLRALRVEADTTQP